MKNPEQRLCVSVAGERLDDLKRKAKQARMLGAGYIEFRIDYLRDPIEEVSKLRSLFSGNEIVTVRKRAQGGKFSGGEKKRVEVLLTILRETKPRTVDVETATLYENPRLLAEIRASGSRLIASHHFLTDTPRVGELSSMLRKVPSFAFAAKIATRANSFVDNLRVLSLYSSRRSNPKGKPKLIAFCMGKLGIYSRVECIERGSPLSYVSLPGEAVAPGQLDFDTMKQALELKAV